MFTADTLNMIVTSVSPLKNRSRALTKTLSAFFALALLIIAPQIVVAREIVVTDVEGTPQFSQEVETTGDVVFQIVNESGYKIHGIEVTLRNVDTGVTFITQVEKGEAVFEGIPPGIWEVTSSTVDAVFTDVSIGESMTIMHGGGGSAGGGLVSSQGGGAAAVGTSSGAGAGVGAGAGAGAAAGGAAGGAAVGGITAGTVAVGVGATAAAAVFVPQVKEEITSSSTSNSDPKSSDPNVPNEGTDPPKNGGDSVPLSPFR